MRVVIVCNGTRGDFQPYLAVALELRDRGHDVQFFTSVNHMKMAEDSNFPCLTAASDMETLLRGPDCKLAMEKGDFALVANSINQMTPDDDELKIWTDALEKNLKDAKPDMVVYNALGFMQTPGLFGKNCPDVPCINVELQPQAVPSKHWKSSAFQRDLPDPDTPTVLTYLWQIESFPVEYYQKLLSEEKDQEVIFKFMDHIPTPEKCFESIFEVEKGLTPKFLAYSPSFWPADEDWPKTDKLQIIGNLKVNKEQQTERASKGSTFFTSGSDYDSCVEFIKQGGPPVYIGWGSMIVYDKKHMTMLAVKALRRAGERGIILGGWAQLGPDGLDGCEDEELVAWSQENVRFAKVVPHELLFPQCKACVHHGGIGTLQASLSAGCPTIITPVFADQFDNARHLVKLECGASTTRLGKLKSNELGDAIKAICTDSKFKANATALSAKMLKEKGTMVLVDWMEKFFKEEVKTGIYVKKLREDKERLLKDRQKNNRLTFQQLQGKWTNVLNNRYPSAKEYAIKNMAFMAQAADLATKGLLWYVSESSALARSGQGLKDPEVGRFRKWAFLQELEKDKKGTRIRVKRMRGRGPAEGWVSTVVNGKDMISKVDGAADVGRIAMAEMVDLFSDISEAMNSRK